MATFQDLELDKFYLIRMRDGDEIKMIQLAMATERAVLVFEFLQDGDISYWKKKDEGFAEVVEELSEEAIEQYEELILEDYDEYDFDDVDAGDKKKKKKSKKK